MQIRAVLIYIIIMLNFSMLICHFCEQRPGIILRLCASAGPDLHFPDFSSTDLFPAGIRLCPHVKEGAEQRPSVCFRVLFFLFFF